MKFLMFLFVFNAVADDVIWLPRDAKTVNVIVKDEFKIYKDDLKAFVNNESLNTKIEAIEIRLLDEDEPQSFYGNAICIYEKKQILISRMKWITSSEMTKQQLIDHELGHCAFGMIHTRTENVMNPESFEYKNLEHKNFYRQQLVNLKQHNKMDELIKRIKNTSSMTEIMKIEEDLYNN